MSAPQPPSDPTSKSTNLVYSLEAHVPLVPALLVSFQQVSAMVVGTITPALILAGILKFSPADTAYLVSMALLASAVGTFFQTGRYGLIGSGLLSVTGTSFAFLGPLIQAGQAGGIALMLGMSLAAAPVQLIFAPFLPKLKNLFAPIVSGVIVLLIGLSLIPTAMFGIAAPIAPGAPAWGGALVAAVVVAVMLIAQSKGRPWARLGSVLFGLIAGYLVCGFAGWLQAPAPSDGTWIVIPKLLPHDLSFSWALLLPFAFIYLASVLEALGDMTATAQLSGLDTTGPEHWTRLRGGIIADGLTSIFAALTGGFPSTTFAQNNGVIQITGVASRRIGPIMALMLAALGLFPAVGRWVTAMPGAILGALALTLFGLVAVSGLRLIERAGLTSRNALIIALSLAVGLGAPTQAVWIKTLPGVIQALLDSGIAAGGLTALALNQILPERP